LAHDFPVGASACIGTVTPLSDALKEICGDDETRNSPELAPVVEQINRALMNLSMEAHPNPNFEVSSEMDPDVTLGS